MRLLVVEDHGPLRVSLVRCLTEAGYAVDATGDGEEALWYLERNDYDLVVLDLMLPTVDGFSIIERHRRNEGTAAILVLSARDSVGDQVRGLDLGADDYMTKPFAVEALLARVRSLLRRRHDRRSPVITWQNLNLDGNARRAVVEGAEVGLTPREFGLLEYLALHQGSLVTRTNLWEHLYAFDDEVTSNVIDQWIARIRRKLAGAGCADPIETLRGQGYRFRNEDEA